MIILGKIALTFGALMLMTMTVAWVWRDGIGKEEPEIVKLFGGAMACGFFASGSLYMLLKIWL
jgi:hypothetical protein